MPNVYTNGARRASSANKTSRPISTRKGVAGFGGKGPAAPAARKAKTFKIDTRTNQAGFVRGGSKRKSKR